MTKCKGVLTSGTPDAAPKAECDAFNARMMQGGGKTQQGGAPKVVAPSVALESVLVGGRRRTARGKRTPAMLAANLPSAEGG